MAEKQGNRTRGAGLDRTCSPDILGLEDSDSQKEQSEDNPGPGTSAEGRDRPPSSRGRDPESPWLGGG